MVFLRTRVKVCGITRQEDAVAAARCGADAIGMVFYEHSARCIELGQAEKIAQAVPVFVSRVALFVDPAPSLVNRVCDRVRPEILQFHGDETPAFCQQFGLPYIKALRVRADVPLPAMALNFASASALLLDTYQPGTPGGTGKTFDWALIPAQMRHQVILAGGLTPLNVGQAIATIGPWAVDVSGGVEQAKGIKDARLIRQFIEQVQGCAAVAN